MYICCALVGTIKDLMSQNARCNSEKKIHRCYRVFHFLDRHIERNANFQITHFDSRHNKQCIACVRQKGLKYEGSVPCDALEPARSSLSNGLLSAQAPSRIR